MERLIDQIDLKHDKHCFLRDIDKVVERFFLWSIPKSWRRKIIHVFDNSKHFRKIVLEDSNLITLALLFEISL